MQKRLLLVSIGWLLCSAITGQNLTTRNITLEQAIEIAHARSPQVQMAQLNFMAQYWDFRSYKAQFLPSLNLHGNLGNYNRSLVDVRDPETGRISYVANNTLNNNLSISIDQNIPLTGGKVSLNTSLDRLDQFNYVKYDDYVSLGSEAAVRDAGRLSVEGKDYEVQDGDVMHFLFNV